LLNGVKTGPSVVTDENIVLRWGGEGMRGGEERRIGKRYLFDFHS
jgi:hypothetical protein